MIAQGVLQSRLDVTSAEYVAVLPAAWPAAAGSAERASLGSVPAVVAGDADAVPAQLG